MKVSRFEKKTIEPSADPRGVAILISMVVLATLSMIGIYAVNTAVLENKMAANYRDAQDALMLAEAAVEFARADLAGTTNHPINYGGPGCSQQSSMVPYPPGAATPQAYICVEHLKYESVPSSTGYGRVHYYRITGIAPYTDQNGNWIGTREVESVERILVLVL